MPQHPDVRFTPRRDGSSKPIAAVRFGYPFKDKQRKEIADPQAFYEGLASVQSGHYLLGKHSFFHGGVHIDRASSNGFSLDEGIRCLADGEVVAYRINRNYHDATPGTSGDGPNLRPYSTGFVLVRHRLQAPTPPQPAKPAPMDNPGADIRNWGTYLYADANGREQVAFLHHGTPLTVEIERPRPGQGSYVRVLDTSGSGMPRTGWIDRTWLAIDPLAGTGLHNVLGFKDRIATTVHRGNLIDPEKASAHARNEAERARPEPPAAPSLTLYSLYMHTADFGDYQKHPTWKPPAWWQGRAGYSVQSDNKDAHRGDGRHGLNVRQGPGSRFSKIGWLGRGTGVALTGTASPDGKWGQIEAISGDSDLWGAPGTVEHPESHRGWVHLGSLDKHPSPERFDEVLTLAAPHPIKQGDVLGYIGEDVPAKAYPIAGVPVSRRLLHLEVFSGDDVPAYLAASRQWAKQHVPDSQRTLLLLRTGDTLLDAPMGSVAFTLNAAQVIPLAGLEAKEVDGKRWRRIAKLTSDRGIEASGWVQEEGRLASPWEWPGFEVMDEPAYSSGAWWDDAAAMAGYIRKEGPRPMESPFYQALRAWLDTNKDGNLSEQELDFALRTRSRAGYLGRLIVRHDSEWAPEPAQRQWSVMQTLAELLSPKAVRSVKDEMPRARKLPWWDEVAAGVEGFPKSPKVYHFHPGGLAGCFDAHRKGSWSLGKTSERYESGGRGPGVVSTGRGDHGGASYGVYQMSSRMGVVQDFIAGTHYRDDFAGLTASTEAFNDKWKEIARESPERFRLDQHAYIKRTHYDIQVAILRAHGFHIDHCRAAVHDMIWSTSVQFGPNSKLIRNAVSGLDLRSATDKEIIEAVQSYKIENNARLFPNSPTWQPNLLERAKDERARLLKLESDGYEIDE